MRFRPIVTGGMVATLSACGGGGGSGGSSAPTAEPLAAISYVSFAFGNQRVGTASSSQAVAISNVGTAPLSITNVALSGTNAASFTISNSCGATLAANSHCTVVITFSPTATGAMTATLVFQTNLTSNPSVALSGSGTASVASVNSTGLTFPNQIVTTVSAPQTVNISNTGTAPLNISSLSIAGASAATFNQSNTCVAPIAPGGSCSVSITFGPTTAGTQLASLSITSDSMVNPSVALNGTAVLPPPPIAPTTAMAVNVLGVAPSSTTGSISATGPMGFPFNYSIANAPSQGTATINSNTGALSYQIQGYPSSPTVTTDNFSVIVSNGYTSTTVAVNVTLNADPLLPNQWHIQNTGQNAFSTTLPVAGNDMDVTGAWIAGYSGKGIKVGVVDTGLEAAHEDLAANVDLSHSINFLTGTNDPTPTTPGFDHGTDVSGIIGAVAFNGKGGRGIAYNATLRGYNYIAAQSSASLAASFGGVAASADNDVFNASFGSTTTSLQSQSQVAIQSDVQTTTLRGGLGAPAVYSAGNSFAAVEGANDPLCTTSNNLGVSCGDPANDEHNEDSIPIIVAALNAAGTHASYSNTGASVWVSAYGGEYGLDSTIAPGYPNNDYSPAIITTSRDGCANAEYPFALNLLDDLGANPFATNCQYTAAMNGTSAAAPNVTGVIALMLEANPKLSWRDVKFILATTAKQVDPGFAGITTSIFNATNVVLEQGWTQNAAGYWFSNRYGFGGVDATAAVSAAGSYTHFLPPSIQSATYSALAGGTGYVLAAGAPLQFTVLETFNTVESIMININIFEAHDAGTSGLTCTQVELVSPSGTKSILMHAGNGFQNAQVNNAVLGSNAFYGESVNGVWTLTFYDFCTFTTNPTWLSLTVPQQLLIVGH